MADDLDQPNSGAQDDGSTASRSESGNRPKDGISDNQLEHDFISVEALSSEDFNTLWEMPNTGMSCRICSPRISRRKMFLIIVRRSQRLVLTARAQRTDWSEVLTIPA